ncbi:MAG: response regulator [Desulfobacteraceae bacterium]|nr:response regulator [Desulfobacteraceae bacterium]
MKALVVDDEVVSRKKMIKILGKYGECEQAENGKEAIEKFSVNAVDGTDPFDVITLDISMPDISGIDVLKRIRNIEEEKSVSKENQVKILMVTSKSDKEVVRSSIEGGCNDYIIKPFNNQSIQIKLERVGLIKVD